MHERSFCETEVQKDPGFWAKVKELFQKLVDQIRRKLEQLAKKDLVVKAAMEAKIYDVQAAVNLLEGAMKVAQEQADAGTTEASETENKKTAGEAVRNPGSEVQEKFSRSISLTDVSFLKNNTTDKKSISEFTQAEINATKLWAYKYYQQMGVKSPFFRAWMDWRAYDQQDVDVADQKGATRGKTLNKDTGWNINISGKVFDETLRHNNNPAVEARPYLPYLTDIVSKAVLLDTKALGRSKKDNSLFMHSFYAVSDIGNGRELLKLYVEEMYDPGAKDDNFRTYKLLNIERQQFGGMGSQNSVSPAMQTAAVNNVADLYALVKQKDKEYKSGRQVNPIFLDEKGKPKIFYHGTDEDFTAFDITKSRSWDGAPDYDLPGFYFSESPEISGDYGEGVHAYYLTAEKIWRTSKDGDLKSLQKKYGTYRAAYDELIRQGYDCVYVDDPGVAESERDYIILKPENIKSAETGTDRANIGTFSRYSGDTKFSRVLGAGAAESDEFFNKSETTSFQLKKKDEYTEEKQKQIQEYLDAVDNDFINFYYDAIQETSKKRSEWMHRDFGAMPTKVLEKIKVLVGFDVSDFVITINGEASKHIEKRHGPKGKHDHTMEMVEDIGRMNYVLTHADNVNYTISSSGKQVTDSQYRNRDNEESKVLNVSKQIDGMYYVVIVVPDSNAKRIRVKSAYLSKKEDGNQEPNANASLATPEANLDISSNFSLTQEEEESQEKNSRILGSDAAEYAEDVKVGNSLNRARIDLLEEMAKDIGVYDEDFAELTAGQARSLARKYNLSGNETHVKEIAAKLLEIRRAGRVLGSKTPISFREARFPCCNF